MIDIPLGALPLYIDSTMLVQFRQCPRKFYYEYIECLRPRGRKLDLVAGSAFAAGLEKTYLEWFNGQVPQSLDGALAKGYQAFAHTWGDFDEGAESDSAKTFSRTFQAVVDYFHIYHPATDHFQPMMRTDGSPSFEFSFAIPLRDVTLSDGTPLRFPLHPSGEPFIYCGRFDAFGHIRGDTSLAIRDEKTSGKGPTKWWSTQWNLRNQFILYTWAASVSGFPTYTVVVRGITIQKTQFQHVEAIKIYSAVQVDRALIQLSRDLHRLVDCFSSGYFDFNFGDSCMAFGRPCSFMDPCSERDPSVWFTDYNRERWSPIDRTSIPLASPLVEAA